MAGESVKVIHPAASVGGMSHIPAAATASTVTLAAPTTPERWCVGSLQWSYSEDPAAGAKVVISDGTITLRHYITTGGPGFIVYDPPVAFPPATAVSITLDSGGGTSSATVNVCAFKVGVN